MPVTPAHPAVVLALRGTALPMSALVVGSMAPDAPLFLTGSAGYSVTHAWWGVLTVDLVVAVLALALWFGVLRDALVDLAPAVVRHRLPERARPSRRDGWLVPVAAVVGGLTHLGWDAFTHGDGWGTARVGWLRATHHGLEGYRWAQYVSGLVGLLVVATAAALELRRRRPVPRSRRSRISPVALPAAIVLAALAGGVAGLVRRDDGLHAMAFDAVITAGVAGAALVAALTVVWHVVPARDLSR